MSEKSAAAPRRPWPLFQSFAGWRLRRSRRRRRRGRDARRDRHPRADGDGASGRISEPQIGFLALVAGAVGFAVFGASRLLSVGADSTIAPIFAGALALLATSGSPHYAADAAVLALGVGLILAARRRLSPRLRRRSACRSRSPPGSSPESPVTSSSAKRRRCSASRRRGDFGRAGRRARRWARRDEFRRARHRPRRARDHAGERTRSIRAFPAR